MQEINRQNYKKLLRKNNINVDVKIDFVPGSNVEFNSITFYFENGTGEIKKLHIDKTEKIDLQLQDLDAIKLQPQKIISHPKLK